MDEGNWGVDEGNWGAGAGHTQRNSRHISVFVSTFDSSETMEELEAEFSTLQHKQIQGQP